MEKAHDVSLLGLPKNMTIGVELEVIGMSKQQLRDFMGMTELSYLDDFHIKKDVSVIEKGGKSGVEVTSPVLTDTEESWRKLDTACRFIRALGGRPNKTCGGHIHLGTNFLGLDTQAWRNFRDLWAEAEPLIYMMANKRGEKPREGAAKYSPPVGQKMSEFDFDSISLMTEDDLDQLSAMLYSRYASYNPTNIGKFGKNTEESRVHNCTIDFDILRENILLFGKMHKICKLRAIDPSIKQKEWDDFFEKDLEEKEKVIRFLDLVFDSEKEKDIFYGRWSSLAGQNINVHFSNLTYKKQFWPELPEDKKEGYGKAKKEYVDAKKECDGPKNGEGKNKNVGDIDKD